MKLQHMLRLSAGLLCGLRAVLAQNVVSQLGGFSEEVRGMPMQVAASPPDALSLFLQQDQPPFAAVAAPLVAAPSPQFLAPLVAAPAPQLMASPGPAVEAPIVPARLTPVEPQMLTPAIPSRPKGLLTLRSLRVSNSGPAGSKISFGSGPDFSMGTDSAGNFVLQQATAPQPIISLDPQNVLRIGSARVEAQALNTIGGVYVRGVAQWQLVYSDDFSAAATGWSKQDTSKCAGVSMLGGYCKFGYGEVNKTFGGLPPHKQLRVMARYHFIDRWIGETGYMKLDIGENNCDVPVWSEQHKQYEGKNGVDLCGGGTPEGKFVAPVEVTVAHRASSVRVTFGSTIGDSDPCDESWGVSGVEVYVRN